MFPYKILIVLLFVGLSACNFSPATRLIIGKEPGQEKAELSWWTVSFKVHMDQAETEPPFYMDGLLALQIQPVLRGLQSRIRLWRFHRRSGHDASGHRFSFIFYAAPSIATQIRQSLQSNATIQALLESGELDSISWPDMQQLRPEIEATSDAKWPLEIQKAWPYFIQGVSETWLRLLDFHSQALYQEYSESDSYDLVDQLEHYRKVHDRVSRQWAETGLHVYLHHLNAVFGYERIFVRF